MRWNVTDSLCESRNSWRELPTLASARRRPAMEGWQTQLVAAPAMEVASRLQLTVLLPAYNEEQAIGSVLEEIVEALSAESSGHTPYAVTGLGVGYSTSSAPTTFDYEILVVDDASTD